MCKKLGDYIGKGWIATDIEEYDRVEGEILPPRMVFKKESPVKSVIKFGQISNILLLIAPPSYTFMLNHSDYYACSDFIKICRLVGGDSPRYIIFIGGLGTIDGSRGMYKWMMENPFLSLVEKKLSKVELEEIGLERELFIFRVLTS
jgi:hypothetical protein